MTFLPIVGRELRVAARRKETYRTRALVAGTVVALSALVFLLSSNDNPQQIGTRLFTVASGGLLAWCLFAGAALTADCLSEEKREGTLGLLFLTDLKGYDVVLGKLATTSVNALYSLLAALPVLALPLLLGGVSPGEWGRMALTCLNAMFLSLTIGLAVSSVSFDGRKAVAGTACLILLFAVGLPGLGMWLEIKSGAKGAGESLGLPSPLYAFAHALDRPYRAGAAKFWMSSLTIQLLAWLFLAAASRAAKVVWHDRPRRSDFNGWRAAWRSWSLGSETERRALRMRLLDINPILWRSGRERWKGRGVWVGLGIIACVWLGAALEYGDDFVGQPSYLAAAILMASWLKLTVAAEAAYAFSEDRRSGALELLLSTPLDVREIVQGQLQALQRHFLAPGVVVLGIAFLGFLLAVADESLGSERSALTATWVAGIVMLVADVAALAVVGMWMGLTQKNANHAAGATTGRILLLPWAVYAFGMLWLAAAGLAVNYRIGVGWPFFLGLWFVPGLVVDAAFGFWAWHKLHKEFRFVAAERFTPQPLWWKRLVSGSESKPGPPSGSRTGS